jgi:DNA segregation ATPase FtsK/SpoIIIE, S-DNA-T family
MVEDQSDDIWGLAFLLMAVLAALGIYAEIIGPAGRVMRTGTADVFGLARYSLPVGFAALGTYLLWRHERSEPGRVAVGLGLALLALSGILGVVVGKDTLHQPVKLMGKAGGLVGAAEGVPLRAALAGWGAGLVLAAVLFLASLIITATPVRAVASGARLSVRRAGRALGWLGLRASGLVQGNERLGSAARHPSVRAAGLVGRPMARRRDAGGEEQGRQASVGQENSQQPKANKPRESDFTWGGITIEAAGSDGQSAARDGQSAARDGQSAARDGQSAARDGQSAARDGQSAGGALPIAGLAGAPRGGQLAIDLALPKQVTPAWRLPPMALLRRSKQAEVDRRQVEILGQTLETALAAHGVETRLVGATVGPSVTRYELELGPGVKVQRVTALQRDIAYAMAATEVRILAPIPGRSAIGVEVPNRQRQTVTLGDIMSSPEASAAHHPLEVAAGRDIAGRPVLMNLAEMPHLLIAGATGSGKSSCINSMLTSVLMRATPDQVRLILIDPKRVELGAYAGLPHLLTAVVTNPKKAANALHWAVQEMERRYDLLAEIGMRDITGYNAAFDRGELTGDFVGDHGEYGDTMYGDPEPGAAMDDGTMYGDVAPAGALYGDTGLALYAEAEHPGGLAHGDAEHVPDATLPDLEDHGGAPGEQDVGAGQGGRAGPAAPDRYVRLPFIIVVVDELNDLMMVAARDVEESICRIAQMARAVGIHLVLATQRPSVDVITGLIKANIPSRLAFAVSSLADSRVVLDQPGAERLIGKGDMLLLTASSSLARRLQGPWVDEEDVRKVVGYWRRQAGASYVDGVEGPEGTNGASNGEGDDDDELLDRAMELVVRSQLGSTSMLQRKLRVGFARAGRLMDLLEQRGIVGPSEGSKARAVLMTVDELEDR